MKACFALLILLTTATAHASVKVTVDNFVRAETDLFFSRIVKFVGTGKFLHARNITNIDIQPVVRMNRDTIYSAAVLDLDAGPVEITLPDFQGRFVTMQIINQDEYAQPVIYQSGKVALTKAAVGTRYALAIIRILVNPNDPNDLASARALQDAINLQQSGTGTFEIPQWDSVSQQSVRTSLFALSAGIEDSRGMFGSKDQVDPTRHLIGAAIGWGGNFKNDALYLMNTPAKNDGNTVYKMHIAEVPVDAFWSISVYNAQGYFERNALNAYSLNSITIAKNSDGSADIQFGGCDGVIANCLPTMAGWNYWVRMYLPKPEVLNGSWKFPMAVEQ